MNKNRMIERGVEIINMFPAKLNDYILKFNKVSKQGAVANIEYKKGSIVEGILYEVSSLKMLDKYEGYPKHYNRIILTVENVEAYAYVANKEYIQDGLSPNKEYLNHLLEGKDFLSEDYYDMLKNIEVI